MIYAEKLKQFNSTEKYKKELEFLKGLIKMYSVGNQYVNDPILDYGCGNGDAVQYLNSCNYGAYGFDKVKHNDIFNYKKDTNDHYDIVYFLHSFAHIENIKDVLIDLVCKKIIVITPNKEWLKLNQSDTYKPDTTVVNHYSELELIDLFESLGFEVELCGTFGQCTGNHGERLFLIAKKK